MNYREILQKRLQGAQKTILREVNERQGGLAQTVSKLPHTTISEAYYTERPGAPREQLKALSDDGRKLVFHLITLWYGAGGYKSDLSAIATYPDLNPGANTFKAIIAACDGILDELNPEEKMVINGLGEIQNPKSLLGLHPNLACS